MNTCNLFFSQTENRYFWTGNDSCSKCKKIVNLQGILVWDYWQTQLREDLYCGNCKSEALRSAGRYAEFKPVVLGFTEMLPEDVTGVWPTKPQLANGIGNVFEVATQKMEGKVNDKTVFAPKNMIAGKKEKLQIEEVSD